MIHTVYETCRGIYYNDINNNCTKMEEEQNRKMFWCTVPKEAKILE